MATITRSAGYSRPPAYTPTARPSCISSCPTVPCIILTPLRLTHVKSASIMSEDLSETGNTRFPRSVLSGTPCASKNAITSAGEKQPSAEYKKRGFTGTFCKTVAVSQLLHTLQRPLPVINSLRPTFSFVSNSVTHAPFSAAVPAAINPAAPPPITMIFNGHRPPVFHIRHILPRCVQAY